MSEKPFQDVYGAIAEAQAKLRRKEELREQIEDAKRRTLFSEHAETATIDEDGNVVAPDIAERTYYVDKDDGTTYSRKRPTHHP